MKCVLLGTSAIALTSSASLVNAAEWEVGIHGYMEQYLAYASSDVDGFVGDDFDGVDAKQDAEIHFKPKITLDNGLQIGVDIQLEANTSVDQIDESYLFIQGSFGEIVLGSENSAGYRMTYVAPDVSFVDLNSPSTTLFIPFTGNLANDNNKDGDIADAGEVVSVGNDVFRGTLGTTLIENERNNDAARITYFTPRFSGFQIGVSYARDARDDNNTQINTNNPGALSDIFDVGLNYKDRLAGLEVAVSARWGIASREGASDPEIWGAGINLGHAGVIVGGSFAEQNDSRNADGTAFDVGISYETGPWGFSFTYFSGENVDDENAALGADEENDSYMLAATYALAKGVKLSAFGAYVDFDEDIGDGGPGTAGNDVDGFVLGTAIKVNF